MTFTIRRAVLQDADIIADFNARLAEESEGKTLDRAKLFHGVQTLLLDNYKGVYHLACATDGKPIGQILFTYEWSDWRNGWFWWVQSVYVTADFRSKGVFRALFNHLVQLAKTQGDVIGFRLYVENDNKPAHEVYRRSGFERAGYFVLERLLA